MYNFESDFIRTNKRYDMLPILFILVIINPITSDKLFKSVPVSVKTYENETVLLPCSVVQQEQETRLRVRWYKGSELLGDSGDPHHLLPPRTRMLANYSLQIQQLQPADTADYSCEVIRPEPLGPIRQTHSIIVQYSPKIRTFPHDGFLEVNKGDYVDIGCEISGNPPPIINWRKNGELMALLEHRARIRFKAEHRLLAGVYQCEVTNGVGDPVTAFINVIINDAPVVSAEQSYVHTAVGLRAMLAANVEFAVPPARTSWYREGRAVKGDERVVIMVKDNIHQLIFRTVRMSDFGNYTFRAENKLGMADVSFKLTGVPRAASFKVESHLNKPTATSFTLIWEVDSFSMIIEYNLWLRPYHSRASDSENIGTSIEPSTTLWKKIIVPGDSTDGPIHSARYTVKGLTPSTVYEAVVTSRNRFGWSKLSAVLHFATEPGTGRHPSTADYSEVTPLLEELEPDAEQVHNLTQARVLEHQDETSSGRLRVRSCFTLLTIISCIHFLSCFGWL